MTARGVFWICALLACAGFWAFVIASVMKLATWAGVL